MDVADLELIEAVAVHGSFSAAAGQLRLSQPSVSARIAAVERSVGATLFLRDSRGARPTEAGLRYLGYVRRSLALLAEGRRSDVAVPEPATVRVGVPASYAAPLAGALVEGAAAADLGLRLRSSHSHELREDLRDERLDVALVDAGPVPVGLVSTHAITTRTVAVAAPEATGDRYAVHDWGEGGEDVLGHLLGSGVPRAAIAVVSPAGAAVGLALHGGWIAVVPRLAAQPEVDAGRLRTVDLDVPHREITLEWLLRRDADEAARRFVERVDLGRGPAQGSSR